MVRFVNIGPETSEKIKVVVGGGGGAWEGVLVPGGKHRGQKHILNRPNNRRTDR